MLWQILVHFLFRLAFGLALALGVTSSKLVTAGFFRVHLWVGLGLNTFAAAIVLLIPDFPARVWVAGIAMAAAMASYISAVIWLYERAQPGKWGLAVVAALNLIGDLVLIRATSDPPASLSIYSVIDSLTASALLGSTFAAMLLGHWYLNTPSMKLAPLRILVVIMAAAVITRAAVSSGQLYGVADLITAKQSTQIALLSLRWLAGLVGILVMTAMTWETLKIPNTQSATGILYVAVIFAFLGELTAQLLAASG